MSGSPEGERITDRSEGARSDWVNRRYTSLHANSSALSGRQGRPPRNTRNLDVVFRSLLINLPVLRTLPRYNLTTRFYVVTYVHRRFYSASQNDPRFQTHDSISSPRDVYIGRIKSKIIWERVWPCTWVFSLHFFFSFLNLNRCKNGGHCASFERRNSGWSKLKSDFESQCWWRWWVIRIVHTVSLCWIRVGNDKSFL